MKLRWPAWGGRTSHRSRPRVAQAIQAARAAAAGQTTHATQAAWVGRLGSLGSVVDGGPRTLVSYAVQSYGAQRRPAEVGLSPTLLHATARAARASGRQPADVWAEALHAWLIGAELGREEATGRPALIPPDPRRTRAWLSIDATLGELRAS